MKKTLLLLALALLATPTLVRAHEDHDKDDRDRFNDHDKDDHHGSVKATELAGIGIGGAALLGVAGYLVLRKRNISA